MCVSWSLWEQCHPPSGRWMQRGLEQPSDPVTLIMFSSDCTAVPRCGPSLGLLLIWRRALWSSPQGAEVSPRAGGLFSVCGCWMCPSSGWAEALLSPVCPSWVLPQLPQWTMSSCSESHHSGPQAWAEGHRGCLCEFLLKIKHFLWYFPGPDL